MKFKSCRNCFFICLFCVLFTSCSLFAPKNAIFTVANGKGSGSINPLDVSCDADKRIFSALFECLTSVNNQTGLVQEGIAESWTFSSDNRKITLNLRQSKWSDGTNITAQTVADSWLYSIEHNKNNPYNYLLTELIEGALQFQNQIIPKEDVSIKVIDSETLEVTFVSPRADAALVMSHPAFAILPMHIIEKKPTEWFLVENFVSNGAFKISSVEKNGTINVSRNSRYWNKENVFLSEICFMPVTLNSSTYELFKTEVIDFVADIPAENLELALNNEMLFKSPTSKIHYYWLNSNNAVLNDENVRKALFYSIDNKELVKNVLNGNAYTCDSFVPPFTRDDSFFDVEKAQEHLAKAGYKNGKNFPNITLIVNENETYEKVCDFIIQSWKKNLNISVNVEKSDWENLLSRRRSNNFDIARAGWGSEFLEPMTFLLQFVSTDKNNDGGYQNATFDSIMRKAATTQDENERNSLIEQAEKIAILEDAALIPLYCEATYNLFNTSKWNGWSEKTNRLYNFCGLQKITENKR